jgi:ribosomal protein S6--L-glutamate ligase
MVGGVPVVLKLTRGTQGIGVMLAETAQTVESILESMWSLGEDIMMQRFVATSRGQDIRAFVCGGRVVAAMRRIAPPGEFRANIHQGARGVAVELPEDYAALAVRAAQVVGLRVAGVDLLQDRDGPCLLEVNPSPGLQGIEAATGRNVAGEVVEEAISLAKE